MLKLNTPDLATIGAAIIARMALDDLQDILQAERDCWNATLNAGAGGQLEAAHEAWLAMLGAINRMTETDRAGLVAIIERVTGGNR